MSGGPANKRSRASRWLRLALLAGALDVTSALVIWLGANWLVRQPALLPPAVPIAVFYTPGHAELEGRLAAAAQAWHRHGGPPVLCLGGARPQRAFYGSEAMARRLAELGVDATSVRTERQSFDTLSNVSAARDLAADAKEIVLVSDVLHLIRIRSIMQAHWPEARPLLYPAALDPDPRLAWERVHYEAAAWLLTLLPDALRAAILRSSRS